MLVAFSAVGCAEFDRVEVADETGFEHLYQRDLSDFEQHLAVQEYSDAGGPWFSLGQTWFAFATCRELPEQPPSKQSNLGADARTARFLEASVALADRRRRARRTETLQNRSRLTGVSREAWLGDDIRRAGFFDVAPDAPSPDDIRWPADEEHWPDELPAAIEVKSQCDTFEVDTDVHEQRRDVLASVERVESAWSKLPEAQKSGALEGVRRRVLWFGGAVSFRYAHAYAKEQEDGNAGEKVLARRALEKRSRDYLLTLEQSGALAESFSDGRRARTLLVLAILELRREGRSVSRDQRRRALNWLQKARDIGLGADNQWTARYLQVREWSRRGEWKRAAKLASPLPPSDTQVFAPFAYRAGLALQQMANDERFLGLIKRVFRDHDATESPFLEALHTRAMRHLAAYPFDNRVVEVLEELGPRSELYRRVEQYARAAIGRGHTDAAEDAADWLLRYHRDARARPRYRAILALVAFQLDEPETFRRQIDKIGHRPESLMQAIPPGRRASFFAPADAALARILRLTLPMMAEWGDTPAAEQRREKWLTIIVEEVQQFLRTTDESIARPALEEMYRLASEQLAEHPRGYAERVGGEKPATLVLGTVRVGPQDLTEAEPRLRVALRMPYSLTLVPRASVPPGEWPTRWPSDSSTESNGSSTGSAKETG